MVSQNFNWYTNNSLGKVLTSDDRAELEAFLSELKLRVSFINCAGSVSESEYPLMRKALDTFDDKIKEIKSSLKFGMFLSNTPYSL